MSVPRPTEPSGAVVDLRDVVATLGQFPSLACLSLGDNGIGEEGAGRLAAVRWQCPSLARLEPSYNLGRS